MVQVKKATKISSAIMIFFAFMTFVSISSAHALGNSNWVKVCNVSGKDRVCNVIKDLVADYGQPLAIFNVITKGNMSLLQVTVPTGRHIPEGITFRVDNGTAKKLDYAYCLGSSCVAQGDIDSSIVNSLKDGSKLDIISVNFQGASNPISVSLKGFKEAYESKGLSEKDFIERRRKLAIQAAKQNEASAKRLLEAQQKVKSSS